MSQFTGVYNTAVTITDTGIEYFFVTKGKETIIKMIHYTYIRDLLGKKMYNLGFGDYDLRTRVILDNVVSNNGDHYRIFRTVLSTIPSFFKTFPNAVIVVKGSDSRESFIKDCLSTCQKHCSLDSCRNAHRRINLYKSYVETNYNDLSREYLFWGSKERVEDEIVVETFRFHQNYYSILLYKIF